MILKVKDKEYNLKFGYKVLAKTTLLKDVSDIQEMFASDDKEDESSNAIENLPKLIEVNSNLVLAALQKYNEDFRVDYDDTESVKAGLEKVYDFMDDYIEEDDSLTVMELFGLLVQELSENGFLSKKSQAMEQAATEQDATIIPLDHQRAEN